MSALTLGHAQICPDDQDQLALLTGVLDRGHKACLGILAVLLGLVIAGDTQSLLPVCLDAVGPVGRVVHVGFFLVDVGLVAVDGVLIVGA